MRTPPEPVARLLAPPARPDLVPTLVDPERGVQLRAHDEADLGRLVGQARDPATRAWTNVPQPFGGYAPADARRFLAACRAGWATGRELSWAVTRSADPGRYEGTVGLRLTGDGRADLHFGLHPDGRGQGLMSAAVRLVAGYALDVTGLAVIRWEALVGNWASRRVVEAVGFRLEGVQRRAVAHHGELRDSWTAALTAEDGRRALPAGWEPPTLDSAEVRARPFAETDLDRLQEAGDDPVLRHWMPGLADPFLRSDAQAYLAELVALGADRRGLAWCLTDPADDRCRGAVVLRGLADWSGRGEFSYWLHPDARGRGLAAAGLRLITAWVETSGLIGSLLIRCAEPNLASRRTAEAAGFTARGAQPAAELLGDGSRVALLSYSRP